MTMKRHPLMGTIVKDKITGITGMVSACCQYITGCDQLLITPKATDDKPDFQPESTWLDDVRAERVGTTKLVLEEVIKKTSPGFGPPAPIK